MNLYAFEMYKPEGPIDWAKPSYSGSVGIGFEADSRLLKAFGASRLKLTAYDTTSLRFHAYGLYDFSTLKPERRGWYKVAEFSMARFPGCCGAMLVHDMVVTGFTSSLLPKPEYEPIVPLMVDYYERTATELGYTVIMASELEQDPNWAGLEYKAYTKAGWKPIKEFVNTRTTNKVTFLIKDLR